VWESLTFSSGWLFCFILSRYVKGVYEPVSSTIGVEFAYKVAFLKNKTKVKAQIWDTCKLKVAKFFHSWI
jgi:hypothetical protein